MRPGFKQTDVGEIPEDWDVEPLSAFGKCLRGVSYDPDVDLLNRYSSDSVYLLRSNNIQGSTLDLSDVQIVRSRRVSEAQELRRGDIVICAANGSRALVGKSARFVIQGSRSYTFGAFMATLRVSETDSGFIFYLLQSRAYRLQLELILAGSSINNLRPSDIEELRFGIPARKERDAIAKILSDTDELIESLDQLITKKQLVKQATMDDLLTGKRRLAGFDTGAGFQQTEVGEIPADWDVAEVAELGQIIRRQMDPRTLPQEWFRLHGIPEFDNARSPLTVLGSEIGSSKVPFEPGDVLFSKLNPRIPRVWVPEAGSPNNVCSPEFLILRPAPILDSRYVSAWFSGGIFLRLVLDAVSGTTGSHQRLDSHAFAKLPVVVPPLTEQRAIAKVLSDMDEDIEVLQQRRDKTKRVKEALMDELLSGRTRV